MSSHGATLSRDRSDIVKDYILHASFLLLFPHFIWWFRLTTAGCVVSPHSIMMHHGIISKDARKQNIDYPEQHHTPHCWLSANMMYPANSTKSWTTQPRETLGWVVQLQFSLLKNFQIYISFQMMGNWLSFYLIIWKTLIKDTFSVNSMTTRTEIEKSNNIVFVDMWTGIFNIKIIIYNI